MNDRPDTRQEAADPGLCGRCRYAEAIRSDRDRLFWRCGRSRDDPAYPRYPALPVRACAGFEPTGD